MTATVDTDVTSFKTKNPTWPNLKFTTPISYMPLSPNLVFDGQHGPTTQIPTQRTSKPKATARQKSSELSGRSLEEENQKISSNPQKYQLHLSDGLSEEEDEDENNENEANLFLEHLQEIHGDIHHHHLQQQEKSYGKSLDGGPGKRHDALIYPVAALDTKRETSKCSNSKERMKAGSNQASSKLKLKKAKGDLVEVHGGRIVRSTGRKDRHSKVCTTRGLRDRRVRLSPNTAIQFYDVQDRLGYDRPSKAIDWLMKEAKSAIDELFDSSYAAKLNSTVLMQSLDRLPESSFHQQQNYHESSKPVCEVQSQDFMNDISDSTCSFFSMLNGVIPPSATDLFHTYSQGNRSQAQGLCHCFQDLSFPCGDGGQHGMLPTGSTSLHVESNQKIFSWNANSSNAIGGEEFLNNSLPLHLPYQHQLPYQREPLQSSFSPSFQAPLNDRLPNLNYACLKYSNDWLLELSAAARILGDEQENQISSEPSSATSLLHFQN